MISELDSGLLISILQIIAIDILLGGDNAIVIALACRNLPAQLRNRAIWWGVFGAIALRVILVFFALQLLALPFLKVIGAALLIWIGIKLLRPAEEGGEHQIAESAHIWGAVRSILIADAVMSIDNVIAVAAAAKGHMGLVAFGIAISVPIIVWGSRLVLRLMERFRWIVTIGGALLGWIGGGMLLTDAALESYVATLPAWLTHATAAVGALIVVACGKALARNNGTGPGAG